MKILHIITGLDRGGAETMLVRLVLRLEASHVVVSLTDEGTLGAEVRRAGISVVALGMRRGRASLKSLIRLKQIIDREQPEILQTWLYHSDFLGLFLSCFYRKLPLVWNLQCSNMDLSQYSRTVRITRWVLARTAGVPAAVIVNSEAGKRYHIHLGYKPRRWELIPNGCDTEHFKPDPDARISIRRELRIREDECVFGMVARVDPMKDHSNFLAAATQIASIRQDAKFLLIGRDTKKLAVPVELGGRVITLGERSDVSRLLHALDVFILSSAFGEGSPNVLVEAMACGIPCVATDVGDSAAIIGDTGAIVAPRTPEALSEAALAVLKRGARARTAARQRVLTRYAIGPIAERYRCLYASLASR